MDLPTTKQKSVNVWSTIGIGERENPLSFGPFRQGVFSMKQAALFLPIILVATGCAMFRDEERPIQHSRAAQLDYIEKYKKVAIAEMNRGGVPASII
ncbi:MAG: hypothetical protein ACREBC_08750, partial [Pyrinomonadaceae bacterium]